MPAGYASASMLFCPDDGLVLHEAARGVYVCHCRGTLLTREAFHKDARELLEPALPRHTEPDVACPRCHHTTSLLRVGHRERWPHWCENCGAIWLRAEDLNALAEVRRERAARAAPGMAEQLLEERREMLRNALSTMVIGPPWEPRSKWDPPEPVRPFRFTAGGAGAQLDLEVLAEAIVDLINWAS